MLISFNAAEPSPYIAAYWRKVNPGEAERLFLAIGPDLTIMLNTDELRLLDKVLAEAFDDGPLSLDVAPEDLPTASSPVESQLIPAQVVSHPLF